MTIGFGELVDKERMASDKLFPAKNCFSAFIKKDIKQLENEIFNRNSSNWQETNTVTNKVMSLIMTKTWTKFANK